MVSVEQFKLGICPGIVDHPRFSVGYAIENGVSIAWQIQDHETSVAMLI